MKNGSKFTIRWGASSWEAFTPLWGKPAVGNAVAAFMMARALGADPELLIGALSTLKATHQRLEVTHSDSVTFLHDGYNSNPKGFQAALDVMELLPGSRRVVITPGMIELGEKQFQENEEIGREIAKHCDIAILVGHINKEALARGIELEGTSTKIIQANTRQEAFEELFSLKKSGDIILIENDLTDLYEHSIQL
jgi:UDP-N-acetylmuramyl pentapeptide synthase